MYRTSDVLVPQVVNASNATAVLTSANTGQFTNAKIVTIGSTVYTFKTALSTSPTVANEVLLGSDADDSLANLVLAINGGAGIGTKYSTGTVANTQVSAGAVTAHATTLTALEIGFAGNKIATTTNESKLSFAHVTMVGGVGGSMEDVAVGVSTDAFYTEPMDVGAYIELIAFLNITAQSGTPTLDVTSQISPDGVYWTDGDAFTQVTTATTQTIKRITANVGKYLRFKVDPGGTNPRYVLTLSLVGKP